nr:uncharacterized protein LOC123281324 [Equus asinus]
MAYECLITCTDFLLREVDSQSGVTEKPTSPAPLGPRDASPAVRHLPQGARRPPPPALGPRAVRRLLLLLRRLRGPRCCTRWSRAACCRPGPWWPWAPRAARTPRVLAHVLQVLAPRLGISLRLVAVDEGIGGYRDAALAAVRRQAARWELPLTVVAYADLFGGWTMDAVARSTAGSGRSRACCCTFCGVLRRRALEEGARLAGATHIVTAVLTGVSPVLRITWLQTVATHGPLFSVGKSWKGETGGQEATEETVGIVQEGDRSLGEDSSLGDGDLFLLFHCPMVS